MSSEKNETPDDHGEDNGSDRKSRRTTTKFFAVADSGEPGRLPRGLLVVAFSLTILVLMGVIFHQLSSILKPLLIAVFLGYLIMPLHRRLVGWRFPSMGSYVLIVLGILIVTFGVWMMMSRSAAQLGRKWPVYEAKIHNVHSWINGRIEGLFVRLNRERASEENKGAGGDDGTGPKGPTGVGISREDITGFVWSTLGPLRGFLTSLFIIIVYLAFLLAEGETFHRRMRRVFGKERSEVALEVVGTINRAISEYISVKTSISFVAALLSATILWLFGVDFFLLWGFLTFLLNFIPYIGSIVATGLPVVLAILQFDSHWRWAVVAVLLLAVQVTTAYVLEPRLTGKRLGLSPLMILVSLAFWGWLWGIVGMILAVPLVVSLKIILDNIEQTRPIAAMMSRIPPEKEKDMETARGSSR